MEASVEERKKILISIVNVEAKNGAMPTYIMGNV